MGAEVSRKGMSGSTRLGDLPEDAWRISCYCLNCRRSAGWRGSTAPCAAPRRMTLFRRQSFREITDTCWGRRWGRRILEEGSISRWRSSLCFVVPMLSMDQKCIASRERGPTASRKRGDSGNRGPTTSQERSDSGSGGPIASRERGDLGSRRPTASQESSPSGSLEERESKA